MIGLIFVAIALYIGIGCLTAYWFGRLSPDWPSFGAILWPITVPIAIVVSVLEYFNRRGCEDRHYR